LPTTASYEARKNLTAFMHLIPKARTRIKSLIRKARNCTVRESPSAARGAQFTKGRDGS
jgi:hypothetical protein